MKSLREYIQDAQDGKVAIGHFNISDLAALKGIFEAAVEISKYRNIETPIIIGVSEGERDFVGTKNVADLVRNLREQYGYPIFTNADHTHSMEKVKEAVEAGFDAILFDAGKLPLEENIKATKEAVEYIKSKNPEILVEAELGYIGTSSAILDKVPEGAAITEDLITKADEAKRFVEETGIDLLAPSVGNIHGMFRDAPNPHLFIGRIKEIKEAVGIPMVLHGGSGIRDEEFTQAIEAGISIIHINTEIRLAWRKGIEAALAQSPNEVAPYKILPGAISAVREVVESRLKLFNGK